MRSIALAKGVMLVSSTPTLSQAVLLAVPQCPDKRDLRTDNPSIRRLRVGHALLDAPAERDASTTPMIESAGKIA
jgi:hypothetical protein